MEGAAATATVDLAAGFEGSGVAALLDRELVGLARVKRRIRETAALLLVDRARRSFGLAQGTPTPPMPFTGSPGAGETTLALKMAGLLHRPGNEGDSGREATGILLQAMENNRDDPVAILARQADRMDRFLESDPGFRSRIAHHIGFPDSSDAEPGRIAGSTPEGWNRRFDAGATAAPEENIRHRRTQPRFANARSIRNALDRARLRQANRLFECGGRVDAEAPMTITEADIRAGRVFAGGLAIDRKAEP